MTYIEFFEKTASENVCACLTSNPKRVIFIGENEEIMKTHIENYKKIFDKRKYNIDFICKVISKDKIENIINLLTEIINTYDNCVFDITGGDEIFNFALGIVYEKNKDKNIKINKIDLQNNVVYDCDNDGYTIFQNTPSLSVDENICIYGGKVVYGDIDSIDTYQWQIDDEFANDIKIMWRICKSNPKHWNTIISTFGAMELGGKTSYDGLTISAFSENLGVYSFVTDETRKMNWDIVDILKANGLITYFNISGQKITVSFKNKQVKKCLTKAGQALEMKILLTAENLVDEKGNPVYNDVKNGVMIDWDGKEQEDDTENEIDILMMHNMIPVFVSCKNGKVPVDELYKLNTVALEFGGEYAKKALIITDEISRLPSGRHIIDRAKEMNIKVIENVKDISDVELMNELKNLWCNDLAVALLTNDN